MAVAWWPALRQVCGAVLLLLTSPAAGSRAWQLPPPTGLACTPGTTAAAAGGPPAVPAAPSTIVLRWTPVAGADRYDVQCAASPRRKPFLSFSTMEPIADIGSLRGSMPLWCRVRSHDKAAASIVGGWSPLSATAVACSTPRPDLLEPPTQPTPRVNGLRSVPVYRISEYAYQNEVDWLENHNSASFDGLSAILTVIGYVANATRDKPNACVREIQQTCPQLRGSVCIHCIHAHLNMTSPLNRICHFSSENNPQLNQDVQRACGGGGGGGGGPPGLVNMSTSPITAYCVDMLDEPWAPYLSCNDGANGSSGPADGGNNPQCECQNPGDRTIANQSMATIAAACGAHGSAMKCHCSAMEMQRSNRSTGRMNVSFSTQPPGGCQMPRGCPSPYAQGYWYSHPRNGECADGESLGTKGCTWKRRPLARVVWLEDVVAAGFDGTPYRDIGDGGESARRFQHNNGVLQTVMATVSARFTGGPCT